MRTDDARAFLDELERSSQICDDLSMDKIMTGPNQGRGTWVHPDLAVNIARWCSHGSLLGCCNNLKDDNALACLKELKGLSEFRGTFQRTKSLQDQEFDPP